jgi:sugar/nucleoside kinase (ribokinase family)
MGLETEAAILVLGNANVDLVLGEIDGWPAVGTEVVVDRSEMRAGGSAGNTSLALSGLNVPHRLMASTGNDPNGAWLRGQFDAGCCDWIIDDCSTTLTVGIVHKGGDRVFFTTPGHLQSARLDDLLARLAQAPHARAVAIVAGGFLMPDIQAGKARLLAGLHGKGWRTAIDPGWPPRGWTDETIQLMHGWLDLADIALINAEEVKGYAQNSSLEEACRLMTARLRPDQILVVKDGAEGVRAFSDGETFRAVSPPVTVIDTVGAGDTFNAAFMAALSATDDLAAALDHGVATASRAISTFPRRYE